MVRLLSTSGAESSPESGIKTFGIAAHIQHPSGTFSITNHSPLGS
jgi:hypothetical protein